MDTDIDMLSVRAHFFFFRCARHCLVAISLTKFKPNSLTNFRYISISIIHYLNFMIGQNGKSFLNLVQLQFRWNVCWLYRRNCLHGQFKIVQTFNVVIYILLQFLKKMGNSYYNNNTEMRALRFYGSNACENIAQIKFEQSLFKFYGGYYFFIKLHRALALCLSISTHFHAPTYAAVVFSMFSVFSQLGFRQGYFSNQRRTHECHQLACADWA